MKKQKVITHQVDAVVRWFWSVYCSTFDHKWISCGGRTCPKGREVHRGECTQIVFRCPRCGDWDYGDKNGPAWQQCTFHCSR